MYTFHSLKNIICQKRCIAKPVFSGWVVIRTENLNQCLGWSRQILHLFSSVEIMFQILRFYPTSRYPWKAAWPMATASMAAALLMPRALLPLGVELLCLWQDFARTPAALRPEESMKCFTALVGHRPCACFPILPHGFC